MNAPKHPKSTVFGLLGGIASGKSAVGRLLAGEAGVVISADRLAHAALNAAELRPALIERFGSQVVGADGAVDRAFLAERVFGDSASRRALEGWIHPVVRATISARLEEALEQRVARIVLDIPLLLENDAKHGFVARCDYLVFVETSAEQRDRQAVANRQWSPGEVARREATQLPLAEKKRRADLVILNIGTLAELEQRVHAALTAIEHAPER